VISINQNSLQKGWINGLLPSLDKSEIFKIKDIIDHSNYINPRSEFIKQLEIGEGKSEIIKALIEGS
jgi:hypothetical protein